MKLRVLTFAMAFLVVISALHVQLNVGWAVLGDELQRLLGGERRTLMVGFLPVT